MTHMGSYQIQDKYSHALLVIRLESSHTIKVSTSKIHKNKHHIHVEYIYIYVYVYVYIYMYMYIYIYIFIYGASPFFPPSPLSGKTWFFGRSFGGWYAPTRANFASAGDEILVHWASSSPLMDHLQSEKSTAEKWRRSQGFHDEFG